MNGPDRTTDAWGEIPKKWNAGGAFALRAGLWRTERSTQASGLSHIFSQEAYERIVRRINKAVLVGRPGHDPKSSLHFNGGAVANPAVRRCQKSARQTDIGEMKERRFEGRHRAVLFGGRGSGRCKYLRVGACTWHEGQLHL